MTTINMNRFLKKPVVLPLLIVLALAVVIFKVKTKPPLPHEDVGFPVRAVEVMPVEPIPCRARATAYGHVEPSVLLKAKAEVSGKVVYLHPGLEKGGSLPAGTVVARIEPTTYEFSLEQRKSAVQSSRSTLRQLEVEEASARRSLKIAQENLRVGESELKRIEALAEKKLVARSALDAEEQKVLQLRQQVEDLKGKLATYSSRKKSLQAQIRQSESQVEQTRDTLGRTEIALPFDARIGEVFVETGEFVATGAVLFEALGLDAVEITAEMPVRQFRPLLSSMGKHAVSIADPVAFQRLMQTLGLEARLRLVGAPETKAYWEAELIRISESVDPLRNTIGLVVAVKNPYDGVIPGERPPLLKGMYTAVTFLAPSQEALVIPRKALHEGRVYLAREDDSLEIRPVEVAYQQGGFTVLKNGVK
jgi:multidrug efflux pump subunit AcrA (membrane-fusion protein)